MTIEPPAPVGREFLFDAILEEWAEGVDYCAVPNASRGTEARGKKGLCCQDSGRSGGAVAGGRAEHPRKNPLTNQRVWKCWWRGGGTPAPSSKPLIFDGIYLVDVAGVPTKVVPLVVTLVIMLRVP